MNQTIQEEASENEVATVEEDNKELNSDLKQVTTQPIVAANGP